jgi:hypothetical protein
MFSSARLPFGSKKAPGDHMNCSHEGYWLKSLTEAGLLRAPAVISSMIA